MVSTATTAVGDVVEPAVVGVTVVGLVEVADWITVVVVAAIPIGRELVQEVASDSGATVTAIRMRRSGRLPLSASIIVFHV